jgi:glycerophosphoryl diester phosphodiesterase
VPMSRFGQTALALAFVSVSLIVAAAAIGLTAPVRARPTIIAHRGASGHRPEHTLEGYRLAAQMGADYIEPDLVSTRDGVLIARHENEIGATTDVADRFPERKRTVTVDGQSVTGWFTEDFTLAEIKTLRARERLAFRSHAYDGQFQIPTFDEVVTLAEDLGRAQGRQLGVYPETKHPTYHRSIGLPLEDALVAVLERHGWNRRDAPVFVQSFEAGSLRTLRVKSPVRLIQLLEAGVPPNDAKLADIGSYADGIGPHVRLVVPGEYQGPTDLVTRAHAAGLLVHVWTLRSEPVFLSPRYGGDPEAEYRHLRDLGVDGLFTDFPDVATSALAR